MNCGDVFLGKEMSPISELSIGGSLGMDQNRELNVYIYNMKYRELPTGFAME